MIAGCFCVDAERRGEEGLRARGAANSADGCEKDGCEKDGCEKDGCEKDGCEKDGCETARWDTTAGGPDWVARCFIMRIITYFTNTLETRPARRTR